MQSSSSSSRKKTDDGDEQEASVGACWIANCLHDGIIHVRDLIPIDVIHSCAFTGMCFCLDNIVFGTAKVQADLVQAVFSVIKLATWSSYWLASTIPLSITHLTVQGQDLGRRQWTVGTLAALLAKLTISSGRKDHRL